MGTVDNTTYLNPYRFRFEEWWSKEASWISLTDFRAVLQHVAASIHKSPHTKFSDKKFNRFIRKTNTEFDIKHLSSSSLVYKDRHTWKFADAEIMQFLAAHQLVAQQELDSCTDLMVDVILKDPNLFELAASHFRNRLIPQNFLKARRTISDISKLQTNKNKLWLTILDDIDFSNMDLSYLNLSGSLLRNTNFENSNLKSSYIAQADFSNANLTNADASSACLTYSDFESATLVGANLQDIDSGRASFQHANLENAYLKGAYLLGSDFRYAKLRGVDISDSNLVAAVFNYSDVSGANFDNALCHSARFLGVDLSTANLHTAKTSF